jgi:hypothetical protein
MAKVRAVVVRVACDRSERRAGQVKARHHSARTRLAVVLMAVTAAVAVMAVPASAARRADVDGIHYWWINDPGRVNDHAYMWASYAAFADVGAGKAASLGCDAVFEDTLVGPLCAQLVKPIIRAVINQEPGFTNGGIEVWVYPWRRKRLYVQEWGQQ